MGQDRELVALLADLVRIESVNPDLVPGGSGERAIAGFVAGWLERAGFEVTLTPLGPQRANVVGVARGSGGGRSLLLNGHLDTVGVQGMELPFEPRIEGNRLYGRGSCDMKTGVAAMLSAAALARARGLRGDLIVTAVADEEYASIGSEAIAAGWRADAAIVTEPTGLAIQVAHKGFSWHEIETRGVAAHGSNPVAGVDAIVKMAPVLAGLETLGRDLRARPGHSLLGTGSIHASLIGGGQELSSYPERCVVSIERRTIPGESWDAVDAELEAILAAARVADPDFRGELRTTFRREPLPSQADTPIVRLVSQEAQRVLGNAPRLIGGAGWTDAALFAAAGMPAILFGPGGEGAHAVVEWADLDMLVQCRDILLATAIAFCS